MFIEFGYTERSLAYEYSLSDKNKKFNQYNIEQQAEIVSHYFDATHVHETPHDRPNLYKTHISKPTDLKRVLSKFLINPDNDKLIPTSRGQENYWFD